jgi:two-component system sensor histidine kinase KdpD
LLSSVSHDFRTPLAAITGAVTCLLQEEPLDRKARRDLEETIREEAEDLERLVANLLDMTRLESGPVELRRDWDSMEEVIGSALARLERRLGGRRVETAIASDLPLVRIDAGLIEQVLVNLIENALEYTPANAPIRIGAGLRDAEVTVSVEDEGPGFPPGDEERVFEKFYRAGGGAGRGFGLGLSICRAIVTAHGGRIRAERREPHGARFLFTLPSREEAPRLPSRD